MDAPRRNKILLSVAVLWLLTGVYIVGASQQAVVTRFGAVVEPRVMPCRCGVTSTLTRRLARMSAHLSTSDHSSRKKEIW